MKERNSNIELLRIIMMLQVVFLHICAHAGYMDNAENLGGVHSLLAWFMWLLSRCPVYMFILIMGYFTLYSKKERVPKKILRVYIPMYFYSVLIPVIMVLTGVVQIDKSQMIKAYFPMLSRTWYFLTLYIMVLALSPYLNIVLRKISKREYIVLLMILFFIFSVWQPLAKLKGFSEVISVSKIINTDGGKSLYGFIYMYILGGFIRRFVSLRGTGADPAKQDAIKNVEKRVREEHEKIILPWINIVNLIIFFLLGIINLLLVYKMPGYAGIVGYNDNPFAVLQCFFLFVFFANLNIRSGLINLISSANLGIYMIHEHPMGRSFIWNKAVKMDDMSFFESDYYLIKILLINVAVFAVCGIIELIRKNLFAKISDAWKKWKLK